MVLVNLISRRCFTAHAPLFWPLRLQGQSARFAAAFRRPRTSSLKPARLAQSSRHYSSHDTFSGRARSGYRYPEVLNIYRAGTFATVAVGLYRVLTVGVFLVGLTVYVPGIVMSDTTSWLWIPVVIAGSAVPMLVTAFATGPMAHSIRLCVPSWARKSADDLRRYATKPPADARIILEYMQLAPWPTRREVRYGDLRRVQPSLRSGIANLEYTPDFARSFTGSKLGFWLVQGYFGRYYINRKQQKDRSAAPGVLDLMWEQIPEVSIQRKTPVVRLKSNAHDFKRRELTRR